MLNNCRDKKLVPFVALMLMVIFSQFVVLQFGPGLLLAVIFIFRYYKEWRITGLLVDSGTTEVIFVYLCTAVFFFSCVIVDTICCCFYSQFFTNFQKFAKK